MTDAALATLLAAIPFALLLSTLLPAHFDRYRARGTVILTATNVVIALALAIGFAAGWINPLHGGWTFGSSQLGWTFDYDGPASLMLTLVAFIGWVIAKYSVRYLDGESGKSRYFRWLALTVGSVLLLVVSGDLLGFWACWILTSIGLHQLLTHYQDRPLARRGAWTKFTVSRIGDVMLLMAIAILYQQVGTVEFDSLNALSDGDGSPLIAFATLLLVGGAMMKTALIPFHTWLPLTIETPTPVSALMHAGIVNAGGYLMIRCSGLLTFAPNAMTTLAIFGAITALYGAVVMITQTSVKTSLAYSTIAQMGFMMLQCGLGAFSAAMLHIIAHSLYKAYAFLSSGSVMERRKTMLVPATQDKPLPWMGWLLSVICLGGVLAVGSTLFAVNLTTKPGGVILGAVVLTALATWLASVFRHDDARLLTRALITSATLCFVYVISLAGVHYLIADSIPNISDVSQAWVSWVIGGSILAIGFAYQWLRERDGARSSLLAALQIHAANGFYIDQCLRRVFRVA